jgi:hypothetical protein
VENRIDGIGFLNNDRCDFQVASAGVAKTGTELARYKVRPGFDPKVDVGFYIATAVAFDDGPAKYRVVKTTLAEILFDVGQIVSCLSPYIATS